MIPKHTTMASREEALEQAREKLVTAAAAAIHHTCGELISDPFNYQFRSLISAEAHAIVTYLIGPASDTETLREPNDLLA